MFQRMEDIALDKLASAKMFLFEGNLMADTLPSFAGRGTQCLFTLIEEITVP